MPLAIAGADRIADMAGYHDISTETDYIARGEIRDEVLNVQDLMNELRAWALSVGAENFSGGGIDLEGLPAVKAEITLPNGQEAATVMTGEDERFYQLIVVGGTPELRQAFFDTFELLG